MYIVLSRSALIGLALALGPAPQLGCGPQVSPSGPAVSPATTAKARPRPEAARAKPKAKPARAPEPPGREVLLGELCPAAADGRPAVLPMFLRTLTWSAESEDVSATIERNMARQFSVLSWDGRRAGIFSVAGSADVGLGDRRAAVGAYAGASPCSEVTQAGPRGKAGQKGSKDPAQKPEKPETKEQKDAPGSDYPGCVAVQAHCGLALAAVEPGGSAYARPYGEDPAPGPLAVGGGCVVGGKLLVDIDGDREPEAYPAAGFLDPVRAPAEEVLAEARGNATCAPMFAMRDILRSEEPNHLLGLHLLGVLDMDGDGRSELVVLYEYPEGRRTWAVYSAAATPARLELIGEAVPWPDPARTGTLAESPLSSDIWLGPAGAQAFRYRLSLNGVSTPLSSP